MTATQRDGSSVRLVPPTGWGVKSAFCAAPRLNSLDGVTLGLLANGKANGAAILDSVASALAQRHRIAGVVRAGKAHPSLPVSDEVLGMFAEHVQVVLTAIGD
ncbi:MAG: hypothetical protein ABIQ73_01570 [Acidimicrobiales bacterium]